jgi:hypothetical protein
MGLELLAKPRDHTARAVQDVSSTTKPRTVVHTEGERTTVEVQTRLKLYNKLQALEALGKHVDVFHAPTADELDEDAFMRDFMAVVFKHVTEPAARAEIKAVINAHRPPGRVRDVTPIGAR